MIIISKENIYYVHADIIVIVIINIFHQVKYEIKHKLDALCLKYISRDIRYDSIYLISLI